MIIFWLTCLVGYPRTSAPEPNYEGLTGDIAFRPSSQRAACVDIRYTLFIIEKYAGASHIIKELTIAE